MTTVCRHAACPASPAAPATHRTVSPVGKPGVWNIVIATTPEQAEFCLTCCLIVAYRRKAAWEQRTHRQKEARNTPSTGRDDWTGQPGRPSLKCGACARP